MLTTLYYYHMSNLRLYVIILLCHAALQANAQAKPPQYISAVVGFYNLENLYDTINDTRIDDEEFLPTSEKKYNTAAYNRKLNNLAQAIYGVGTDNNADGLALLGVVEIENATVLKDLCATDSLKQRNYQYVHYDSPDARGIDVGLLYNPRYFTVINSWPHQVTLPNKHATRNILVVQGDFVGDTVYVLVNHWPSRRGGNNNADLNNKDRAYSRTGRAVYDANTNTRTNYNQANENGSSAARLDGEEMTRSLRIAAAKDCMQVIDSIQLLQPNAKIMIMGDFNDDPNSPSIKDVMQVQYTEADVPTKGVYNALGSYFINGKGKLGSLAYGGKWNLTDQLMYTKPLLNKTQLNGWFLYSSHIYYRPFLINQTGEYKGYPKRSWVGNTWNEGYSDHLPVYSILVRALPE